MKLFLLSCCEYFECVLLESSSYCHRHIFCIQNLVYNVQCQDIKVGQYVAVEGQPDDAPRTITVWIAKVIDQTE
jgi:hypothetical protein